MFFFCFFFVIVDVVFVFFSVGCTLKAQAFKVLDNHFEETEGFDFPVFFVGFFFPFHFNLFFSHLLPFSFSLET